MSSDLTPTSPEIDASAEGHDQRPVVRRASASRRFAAIVIDVILAIALALVGWLLLLIWLAGRGQTPGKAVLGLRIVGSDGRAAGRRTVLIREIASKYIVGSITLEISTLVGGLQIVWDQRAWWDKVHGTTVVSRVMKGAG